MWDALGGYSGHRAWVAEIDDVVAGFLDLFVFPDVAHGAPIAIINNLIVGEPFRRRGLGKGLLHAAVDQSSREQAVEVHAWTDFDNARDPAVQERRVCGEGAAARTGYVTAGRFGPTKVVKPAHRRLRTLMLAR